MGRFDSGDPRVNAWWDAVLAGDVDEPHPILGDSVRVRVRDGCLILSGELARAADRDHLIRQARARIGAGFRDVDVSRLRLADSHERPGILDQTLIAAYPDPATARRASDFVLAHSRVRPRHHVVVESINKSLRQAVPADYIDDARKRLAKGDSLLVMRVDETDAFRVRELMEEDTRSSWTVAAPPELSSPAER